MGEQMVPSRYRVQEGPCVEWIHSGDAGTTSGNTMHCSNMNHNLSLSFLKDPQHSKVRASSKIVVGYECMMVVCVSCNSTKHIEVVCSSLMIRADVDEPLPHGRHAAQSMQQRQVWALPVLLVNATRYLPVKHSLGHPCSCAMSTQSTLQPFSSDGCLVHVNTRPPAYQCKFRRCLDHDVQGLLRAFGVASYNQVRHPAKCDQLLCNLSCFPLALHADGAVIVP